MMNLDEEILRISLFSLGFNFLKRFILIFQLNYRANFQRLQKQLRDEFKKGRLRPKINRQPKTPMTNLSRKDQLASHAHHVLP
jgi:hypothetical protein